MRVDASCAEAPEASSAAPAEAPGSGARLSITYPSPSECCAKLRCFGFPFKLRE